MVDKVLIIYYNKRIYACKATCVYRMPKGSKINLAY